MTDDPDYKRIIVHCKVWVMALSEIPAATFYL